MIRINLLPHREIRRKQQQKEFFFMLGAVVGLGIAIWFAVHTYLAGQLEEQQGRNGYLDSEIAALDKQIDEIKKLKEQTAALLQRKKVVESLQANRAETASRGNATNSTSMGSWLAPKGFSKPPSLLVRNSPGVSI